MQYAVYICAVISPGFPAFAGLSRIAWRESSICIVTAALAARWAAKAVKTTPCMHMDIIISYVVCQIRPFQVRNSRVIGRGQFENVGYSSCVE